MSSQMPRKVRPFPAATTWGWRLPCMRALVLLFVFLTFSAASSAYSILTHEEIVDLVWTSQLRLLLLQRYPGLSEDELTEAHAYAYGGAVIQDLGYYPLKLVTPNAAVLDSPAPPPPSASKAHAMPASAAPSTSIPAAE